MYLSVAVRVHLVERAGQSTDYRIVNPEAGKSKDPTDLVELARQVQKVCVHV